MSEQIPEEIVDDPWTREQLEGRLAGDEQVIATADAPAWVFKKYRTRYVLTDRRLIRLQRNFFNITPSKEYSLSHISSISQTANPIPVFEFEGSGDIDEKIILASGERASHFLQEFRKQINQQ